MRTLWNDTNIGVRVVRLTEPEEIEELVRLFEIVAEEEGWKPDGSLRYWTSHSAYFAIEVHGQLAGGLQLVLPNREKSLPCQILWPEVLYDPANCMGHVAILALTSSYRGQSILFWSLGIEMWRHCVGESISTLCIEVTPRVLPLYRRLGWPLNIVGDKKIHWGEDCYLCTLGIPDVAAALLRRAEHSPYYRQLMLQAFRVASPSVENCSNQGSNEINYCVY